jgi:hypothetical protein
MRNLRDVRRGSTVNSLPRAVCALAVALLLAAIPACTRSFYRNCADKEVNDILAEKDKYPAWWKIQLWHVYPDPRARFADPTNPDRPPMPPDDPAADQLSPHPQQPGHAGVARVEGTGYLEIIKVWDAENREQRKNTDSADNADSAHGAAKPETEQQTERSADTKYSGPIQTLVDAPVTETQGFLLTLDQSAELGVINSRDYQRFREDLYLLALPVTTQRFSFAFQWLATETAFRQWAGVESLEGHKENWTMNSTIGVSKLFSTGALLTTAFANSTVWNFLAPRGHRLTSQTTMNLDFIQPLLRGGGKAVTLEPLTQAERNLLYSIRAYARFRELFYLQIALGSSIPSDLATAAGASNVGSPISILAALGIASTDVAGGFVGYLSTLFREVDMAADRKWVQDLEKALKIYEGYQEGGIFSPLQVDQVRSTLLQAKNTVLNDAQFYNNALDQFKLLLGVPVNMPLILDDSPARPITRQFDRYYAVIADSDAAYKLVETQDQLPPAKLREFLLNLYTTDPLVRGTEFRKQISPAWQALTKLDDKELRSRLETLSAQRRKLLDAKTDLELKGKSLSSDDARLLRESEFEADLGNLEQLLREYEKRSWEKRPKEQQRPEWLKQFRLVAYSAQIVLVTARNQRFTEVGTLWPQLPSTPLPDCGDEGIDLLTIDVDRAQEIAVQTALTNRTDLMNARAQVVDAWRQLRVTANALMGVFNVQYHMDSTTPPTGSNPLAFSTHRTNAELILNAQLPLTRMAERNAYRAALIFYQRARRNLINLEDGVAAQVRFDVRQLHLFGENYKIQQKVIQSLYSQVENALELIVAPADPDNLKATGTAGAANAAALTNQYLQALGSLNGAQTKMYDYWLSILATRMQLYTDLERLTLDSRGVWTDESGQSISGQSGPDGQWGPAGPCDTPAGPADRGPHAVDEQPLPRPRFLTPWAVAPLE